ncbi:FadR/GntR family transcriptional regulator [Rhizobium leguminosarum]|uniref:FadR/GntR family transcriptional regulator n=1 Tax=Rhizobium leguminosarum TaxID=384 RepID=UPI001C95FEFB|nr:FadR/GntR family transcriptional regulator [Rhizobium leguminosarum]MBY5406773.1 FadR family transcriptional regulator [Rhizobium leguminosarum]
MPIRAIEPNRIYRQIASQIAELVRQGEFHTGERLPAERDLAHRLGVSRSSLREALIALEIEGIVEVRSGSGVYVLDRTESKASFVLPATTVGPFDIIRARSCLETEIAITAVRVATDQQINQIESRLQVLRLCVVGEPQLIDADHDFHRSIAEASGNGAYILLLDTLWEHRTAPLYYKLENHFQSSKVWKCAMQEHERIFAAIAARDEAEAAQAVQDHMRNAEERLAANFEQ